MVKIYKNGEVAIKANFVLGHNQRVDLCWLENDETQEVLAIRIFANIKIANTFARITEPIFEDWDPGVTHTEMSGFNEFDYDSWDDLARYISKFVRVNTYPDAAYYYVCKIAYMEIENDEEHELIRLVKYTNTPEKGYIQYTIPFTKDKDEVQFHSSRCVTTEVQYENMLDEFVNDFINKN